ncbi:hypothetical protein AB0J57_00625 [Streptomyces sp. NPDC049837]|uniref:hypothetical protein n=1 Tax=Streptomyces sp. NPDC049837 TaxID=3155277 RepID=UPI00343429BC
MVLEPRVRRRAAVFAGSALLSTSLAFTLSACGSSAEPPAGRQAGQPALELTSASIADAVEAQATALVTAADKADKRPIKPDTADKGVCTTDPADRAACRNPSGKIDPNGGDLDGDGVFEPHEPVGPAYKDPRAYDGGKTSGETQCEWLRSRGLAC